MQIKTEKMNWTDIVVCLWYVYVLISAWAGPAYPCFNTVAGATYMLSLYLVLRLVFSLTRLWSDYIIIGIVVYALFELMYGAMQLAEGGSNHYLYPMTGTFLNPGPYSASLAMGLVVLCQYKEEMQKDCSLYKDIRLSHLLTVGIMAFIIILPSTWSRAALLSAAVCLCIVYWKRLRRWRWWLLGVCLVAIALLYYLKSGSANGRLAVNYIAAQCVVDSPLVGNGIGSFFYCYAGKTAELANTGLPFDANALDVLDYAFNDFMLVAVEQGLAGLMFALLLAGLSLYTLWRMSRSLALGLLSLLAFSLFSYPFELLPYQVIAVVLIAYSANGARSCKLHVNIFAVMVVALLLAYLPWGQLKAKREAEREYKMMAGMTDKAFIDDYYELMPMLDDNRNFLFDFAKTLRKARRYNDSNAMLRKGALISNDPMFYVLQGNNYRDMGYWQLAENSYQKAFSVMPNRLYPLYQLMRLYEQMGDKEKTMRMAWRIISFKEKVESPATREMKRFAREKRLSELR